MQRCVVVGAGAVGVAIALRLQASGCRTTLVGPHGAAGQASTVAGAMLGVYGEVTAAAMGSAAGRNRIGLDRQAAARWPSFIAEVEDVIGPITGLRTSDSTVVLRNAIGSAAVDDVNYLAIKAALAEFGASHHTIDDVSELNLLPEQASRPMEALLILDEGSIDPVRWLAAARQAFERLGGRTVEARVTAMGQHADTVTGVVLDDGETVPADHVVLAAGVHTHRLLTECLGEAGGVIPMLAGAGVSALVRTADGPIADHVLRTPNRAFACGLHAVPRADGLWYLGATNHIVIEPVTEPLVDDVIFLLNCSVNQLSRRFAAGRMRSVMTGNRPVPIDGHPMIGRGPRANLWLATGTYREGIHLSPSIADHLCAEITGLATTTATTAADWDTFNPVRLPIQAHSRAEIIDMTVEQALATGDEASWKLPAGMREDLAASYRKFFTANAEKLNTSYTPPPEILTVMHQQPGLLAYLRRYYRTLDRGGDL